MLFSSTQYHSNAANPFFAVKRSGSEMRLELKEAANGLNIKLRKSHLSSNFVVEVRAGKELVRKYVITDTKAFNDIFVSGTKGQDLVHVNKLHNREIDTDIKNDGTDVFMSETKVKADKIPAAVHSQILIEPGSPADPLRALVATRVMTNAPGTALDRFERDINKRFVADSYNTLLNQLVDSLGANRRFAESVRASDLYEATSSLCYRGEFSGDKLNILAANIYANPSFNFEKDMPFLEKFANTLRTKATSSDDKNLSVKVGELINSLQVRYNSIANNPEAAVR